MSYNLMTFLPFNLPHVQCHRVMAERLPTNSATAFNATYTFLSKGDRSRLLRSISMSRMRQSALRRSAEMHQRELLRPVRAVQVLLKPALPNLTIASGEDPATIKYIRGMFSINFSLINYRGFLARSASLNPFTILQRTTRWPLLYHPHAHLRIPVDSP